MNWRATKVRLNPGHLALLTLIAAWLIWYAYDAWSASARMNNLLLIAPAALVGLGLVAAIVGMEIRAGLGTRLAAAEDGEAGEDRHSARADPRVARPEAPAQAGRRDCQRHAEGGSDKSGGEFVHPRDTPDEVDRPEEQRRLVRVNLEVSRQVEPVARQPHLPGDGKIARLVDRDERSQRDKDCQKRGKHQRGAHSPRKNHTPPRSAIDAPTVTNRTMRAAAIPLRI